MIEKEIKEALKKLGIKIGKCRGCGKEIVWLRTKHGNMAPVTMELKNHFADCPEAGKFRKKEKS